MENLKEMGKKSSLFFWWCFGFFVCLFCFIFLFFCCDSEDISIEMQIYETWTFCKSNSLCVIYNQVKHAVLGKCKCFHNGQNQRILKTIYWCISNVPQNLLFCPQSILFPLNVTLLKVSFVPKKMELCKILSHCRAAICPVSGCHMLHLKTWVLLPESWSCILSLW